MGKHKKYTPEFKIQCVKDVLEGRKTQSELARIYEMEDTNIIRWIKNYQEHGEEYFYQEHRGTGGGNPYAALHKKKTFQKWKGSNLKI